MRSSPKVVLGLAVLTAMIAGTAMGQIGDEGQGGPPGPDGSDLNAWYYTPALRVVSVDCDRNKSINRALKKRAHELIIEISGICTEDVVIRRDNVTLRGTDPATDGIQPETTDDPIGGTVMVREARGVRFENLQFTGNTMGTGLRIENSQRGVSADNCIFSGNRIGVLSGSGFLDITNSDASNNSNTGIAAADAGRMTCTNCTINNNNAGPGTGIGVFSTVSGSVVLTDTAISGSRFGIAADTSGHVEGAGVAITGIAFAVLADDRSGVDLQDGDLGGAIFVNDRSRLSLAGMPQTANPLGFNLISSNSSVLAGDSGGTASSLGG